MSQADRFSIRRDGIAGIALCTLVALAFSPFIFGHSTLQDSVSTTSSLYPTGSRQPANGDMSVRRILDPGAPAWQTEPEFVLEHRILSDERALPVWNPYSAYGTPLLANMQSQPLTPLAWIAIASPTALAYNLWTVFRLIVAALLAYAYCRLFTGYVAAFCGATCYAFSGFFLLYLTLPELSVDVVAPALLIAIELQARRPSFGSVVAIGVAVALLVFGGMPEQAFLFLVMGGLYAIVRRAAIGTAFGMILGACLAAVLIVPFLEYIGQSFSLHGGEATVGSDSDPPSLELLSTYIVPLLFGPPENDIRSGFSGLTGLRGFFGPAAFVLALSTFFNSVRRTSRSVGLPKVFFQLIFIVLLAKRFGIPGPQQLGLLPVLRQIILLKYDEPLMALCISILVAYAVERMIAGADTFRAMLSSAITVLLILVAVAVESWGTIRGLPAHKSFFYGSLVASMLIIVAITLPAFLQRCADRKPIARNAAIVAIVIGSGLGAYFIPMYYFVDRNPDRSASTLAGAPYIDAARNSLHDGRRFFSPGSLLYPEWGAAFGIPDVRALDALYDSRYLPFVRTFLKSADAGFLSDRFVGARNIDFGDTLVRHWLELSRVGTVAVERSYRGLQRYPKFYDDGIVRLYHIVDTPPAVAAFTNVVHVSSGSVALKILADPHFNPLTTAVVEDRAVSTSVSGKVSHFISGTIVSSTSTVMRALIRVTSPAVIVDSTTNYPGWHAYIDGVRAPVLPANYLFRGVAVSAGVHTLEFRYEPVSFALGLALTSLAIVVSISLLTFGFLQNRRATA